LCHAGIVLLLGVGILPLDNRIILDWVVRNVPMTWAPILPRCRHKNGCAAISTSSERMTTIDRSITLFDVRYKENAVTGIDST
jgi:hypothetical protein